MMTGQARSSVTIMGLDTHMILETVPVPRSPRRTAHHAINRSSRHYAGAVAVSASLYSGSVQHIPLSVRCGRQQSA